jgi:Uma2 family endonuclease
MQLLTKKFTVQQYHKMAEAEVFTPQERLELIKGEVVKMSPIGLKHATTVNRLNNLFHQKLLGKVIVSVLNSVQLNDYSEPQPDLVLLKFREDFYANKLPQSEDILLLIEVSDSTIKYDREVKIPLYAENNIQETWLVNVENQLLEVYTKPQDNQYQNTQILTYQQSVFPINFSGLTINLTDIFG